jgi:hypothetical protein
MTEPKSSELYTGEHKQNTYPSLARANGGAWVVPGRAAYREEFQRDYGPDPDERLDRTESGREF